VLWVLASGSTLTWLRFQRSKPSAFEPAAYGKERKSSAKIGANTLGSGGAGSGEAVSIAPTSECCQRWSPLQWLRRIACTSPRLFCVINTWHKNRPSVIGVRWRDENNLHQPVDKVERTIDLRDALPTSPKAGASMKKPRIATTLIRIASATQTRMK